MSGRKQGELEAITILESIGIQVDRDYLDDNSHKSMPDVKCADGRYIEVTHTLHNNSIPTTMSRFDRLQPGEDWSDYTQRQLKVETECSRALDRIRKYDYEKDDTWKITPAGQAQFKKDIKLLKEHMGYDVTEMDPAKQFSEFKCDHPSMLFSTDNILREITKDKGEKYPNGDVDLFIFAADEEFRLMKELIPMRSWNGTARGFLNQIIKAPFPKIYVCEWCFDKQEYNTDDPQIVVFYKYGDGLKWEWHNLKHTEETEMGS
jgi:hypothetical protein